MKLIFTFRSYYSECGGTFQENAGSFHTYGFYSPTPALIEARSCEFRITATHGERIVLNITELDVLKSDNCRTDFVEVRDGYWHKSPVLGRYCGLGRIPELIKSTSSRMLVTFVSSQKVNATREYRGFAAHYEGASSGLLDI